jgi:hypothetical protein
MRQAVLAIAVLLSLCLSCFAQSKPRVALDIGSVTVYLGMPREDFIKKCATAGYKQSIADKDTITLQIGGAIESYTVQFRNDRIVYADREWYLTKGDLDAFESTIAALGSLADNEKSPLCIVSQVPVHTPDGSSDNIFISCGQRTITLSRVHLNSVAKTGYSVREQIGEMLPAK